MRPAVKVVVLVSVCCSILGRIRADYDIDEDGGIYVPKYLQQKYSALKTENLGSYSGVKTFTKTKTIQSSSSPFLGHVKTNTPGASQFNGGCTTPPPTPMNAALRCSKFSGCRIDCIPNYKFPNEATVLYVHCEDGQWVTEGVEWEHLPSCEPICLPECQNNGICVAPGQCNCPENFSGPQCQFENKPCLNYPPMPQNSRRLCRATSCTITCLSGHQFPDGSDIANMICKDGTWQPTKENWVTIPDCEATCDPPCQNGGNCLSFNICQCPQDFRGPQCQYRTDACNAKKLAFNGGYNCSGTNDFFSCSVFCPQGVSFEFPPALEYTCTYDVGVFEPSPIPQCLYEENMEVIPTSQHEKFTLIENFISGHSYSGVDGGFAHVLRPTHETVLPEIIVNDSSSKPFTYETNGVRESQLVVVEEKLPKPGVCFSWGGAHYKTFDGRVYSFESDCAHTMVRDSADGTFSIVVQNVEGCREKPLDCYRLIKIYYQDKEYVLKRSEAGIPIFVTPKRVLSIPGQLPGIRTEMSAHFIVVSLDTVGAKIKWDGQQLVQVEIKENLWNRTEGLCGKIDGNSNNDLRTKDEITPTNLATLATSWQVDSLNEICSSLPKEEHACLDMGIEGSKAHNAAKFCKKLLSDPRFVPCHSIMDIVVLEDACRWDYCSCSKIDPTECACETMNVYVRECLHKGVKALVNWRDQQTCPMKCTGGRIYMSCGPSKGQAVCGTSTEEFEEGEDCVEGCYCPPGTVLHESQCITKDKCPCQLRGQNFPPGSSVPKECNTCTCLEGQWVCTQVSCGARCSAIGDPHYTTFDGRRYDFMGQCSYYLVKHDNFTIEAENVACAGSISQAMNLPISVTSGLPSCTKTVTIKMAGQTIKLKQNHELVVNGQDVTKLPHNAAGIKIRIVSSIFLQVELPNGVEVWWDGLTRAYIDVPASFQGKTKGLCGTFNSNQKDDFLTTEDDVEKSVVPFANKWKTSEKCNDVPDKLLKDPCEVNLQNKPTAEMYCRRIKSDLFKACHFYVDPEPYYKDCMFDMCSCETKISKCLCSIFGAYAQECSHQGIKIEWREHVQECGVQCSTGQKYQVCSNSCSRTCYDVATRTDCRPHCVEGCNCPEGEALNDDGECIPLGQCSCWYNEMEFPPGYKEVRPASKAPELCTCINAQWTCRPATPSELQDYPNANDIKTRCSAVDNLEFTTCESSEPTTCKNMHSKESTSPAVCHPGCQCKSGYVLDTTTKQCIPPTECPCHHGGMSYGESTTVQSDCNTCTCKNGKWECTERQCAAECSAWGDSHYKTFDGKHFDYQGQCDYVFAKGFISLEDSFSVILQSIPCGSLGVTCSKSLTIKIGAGLHQEAFTISKDKPLPGHKMLKRLTVRQKGLLVIAESADLGLVLHWNQGTRIYFKVDPKWKNKVKGLCGNYNDNEADDFQTPSGGMTEVSANIFGDSWKLQAYCPQAEEISNTCQQRPERKVWALKQCGILKSSLFAPCHSEVPFEAYLERCIFDSCGCDQGGDCECLCTALAAYAQECNNHGVPIKWRSPELCPMQCDDHCTNYSPCISSCPIETCDNLLVQNQLSKLCSEDTCIEGCQPKTCPTGFVYSNASLTECVPRNTCKVFCMEVDGKTYYEGDLVEEDECHSCFCSRGKKTCQGKPCPTVIPSTTQPPQNEEKLKCAQGWTEWINQDRQIFSVKETRKPTDAEPLPDLLVLNIMKSPAKCNQNKMTEIECRTVKTHIPAKETGFDVECSLERGLVCVPTNGEDCPDFEIRVFCKCEEDTSTTFLPEIYTTVEPSTTEKTCDSAFPNKEDPQSCQSFYQCEQGVEGVTWVKKDCGPGTFYNPQTQVCDFEASVIEIKPSCKTPNPADGCQSGAKLGCVIPCEKLCAYYEYVLQEKGVCRTEQDCAGYDCVAENTTIGCPSGQHFANEKTCLNVQDCLCTDYNGNPVKPGEVKREGCEACQCINNFYTCDKTACETTEQIVTFAPVATTVSMVEPLTVPSTVTPPPKCNENNFINLIQGDQPLPDEAFSATSYSNSYFLPQNARMLPTTPPNSGGSWSPKISSKDEYLQIVLDHLEPVYGVIVAGNPLYDEYVTSYQVLYSPDAATYSHVTDIHRSPETFRGSTDKNTPVKQVFDVPIEAKVVRIKPQTWHNAIALRVELIGCGEGVSTVAYFTTPPPEEKICDDAMGVDNGALASSQISVSSELKTNSKEELKLSGSAWQPRTNSPTEFVQFDFVEPRNLTGVVTKGGRNGWVTRFTIQYSQNEKDWNPIVEDGKEKVFLGNFDSDTPRTNDFAIPISSRYLKIVPIKWHNNIQMRIEPHGCFKPYPEKPKVIEELNELPGKDCHYCPGIPPLNIELGACKCKKELWWDGEGCVERNQCPCVVGHIPYVVGSIYEKEDCSVCTCKLGGVSHCNPKQCDPCPKGLRNVITSTCQCICKPCEKGTILCPTSGVCINETLWCNGVKECPDDETGCEPSATPETIVVTQIPVKTCPKITCPPGYKEIHPTKSKSIRYHSYLSPMFSKFGRKTYSGIKSVKTVAKKNKKKPLEKPTNIIQNDMAKAEEKCPEIRCILPPPPFPTCPSVSCPNGFVPEFTGQVEMVKGKKCNKFYCRPLPPPEAVCNITGRTFNTFDGTEYKYDICYHIIARDLINDEWDISLKKNCTDTCSRDLIIHHQEHTFILHQDLTIEYDDYIYTVEQTKRIGSQAQFFTLSLVGSSLLFASNHFGFWVMLDRQGNAKIGVVTKLLDKVDGLCGYYNEFGRDDKRKPDGSLARTTAEFGDSWASNDQPVNCEVKTCPLTVQSKAWEICNKVRENALAGCASVVNVDAFVSRCLETTCNCLEAAKENTTAQDKCRCDTLQSYVVDCLTADNSIDLMDWRMQNDCPATCEPPLVFQDCYQRRCEPTCESINDPTICPKLPNLCFPGCYCPAGLVRHGDECISPSNCRDCECNVLPHLQYITYDESNFTVNGNCVYVMSRDHSSDGKHAFQVLVTNAPCRDTPEKMCVGKVTILYEGHKIHILYDQKRDALKLIIDGEVLTNFATINDWATVTETPAKHIKFLLKKLQVEVSVYFPSLGVSVKAPSHKYGGSLEGLCGDCNRNPDDDFGIHPGDVEEFALSWLYENLPGGQSKESCTNIPEEKCESLAVDDDPCVQLVDIDKFGQCHPLLDPTMFIEWCQKDTCGGHPERACNAIEAYASECMHSGFCVNWRSDLCPAESCPLGQSFKPCEKNCVKTCEDVTDESKKCPNYPSEGCFCEEGKVLLNGTCVEPVQCQVCDEEGHHPGDTWQKDACTSCSCEGTSLKCETKHCPAIDAVCEVGLTPLKVASDEDTCCPRFVCVPEATQRPTCDPPQEIPCGPGQILKLDTKSDGCQQFVCQCKPIEDCDNIELTPESPLEAGYERFINSSGCCPVVELICKPELCPKPASCEQFYNLKKVPGKCCPSFVCEPPKEKCIFDSKYAADENGGEKVKGKYEKQKELKNVNETWQDGPCRQCSCLEVDPNTYQASCTLTECPILESFNDYAEYALEFVPIPNTCCPKVKRTGCRHSDKIFLLNDEWFVTDDYCTKEKCVEHPDSGLEKRRTTTVCNVDCDPGFKYEAAADELKKCCGGCKQVACVVDGVVRNVGEKWTSDDYCNKFECVNVNNSFTVHSTVDKCDKIPQDLKDNYVYETIPIEGQCCAQHKMVACKVGEKHYKVGEIWPSPDGDKCKNITCVQNELGALLKQELIQTCSKDCKLGWEYKESVDVCCGECVPVACVVDGVLKQAGENWTSSDGCTFYSCEQFGDQFSVATQQEFCPEIEDCPQENVYVKGCCKHCNVTAQSQVQCGPKEVPLDKTIEAIKQTRGTHGFCTNKAPINGFTECSGNCQSTTTFNSQTGTHDSNCACCRATDYESLEVELECEDGFTFMKKVAVPRVCGCEQGCLGVEPEPQKRSYKTAPVKKYGVKTG